MRSPAAELAAAEILIEPESRSTTPRQHRCAHQRTRALKGHKIEYRKLSAHRERSRVGAARGRNKRSRGKIQRPLQEYVVELCSFDELIERAGVG